MSTRLQTVKDTASEGQIIDSNHFLQYRSWVEIRQITKERNARISFDVLLTVHLSIILVIHQLNAQVLVL